jgi:AraC-like DNA-binding protein
MTIAFIRHEHLEEKRDCDFQSMAPAESSHWRVFVHGYADVPYHWHREMEILFVLRGSLKLVVDGQICEMNQDDVIIINADVPHNSASNSLDALICGVHLDASHFERMGLRGFGARQYLCRTFLHNRSFMQKVAPIKAFMARLILDQTNLAEEMMVRDTIASLLACYIYRTIAHEQSDAACSQLRNDSRNRILRIMDTLGGRDVSQHLGEIAEAEGLTISHLSRLFKRHLGIGYRDYSHNLRLDNAAEELRNTDSTIGVIMERNGFGNPAVFYNKFRSRFGCSPAEFRRGRRSLKPQSALTKEDAAEAQKLLAIYAANIGMASELAVGLTVAGRKHLTLSAPHSANA